MNLFAIRKHVDVVLHPIVANLAKLPLHANQWTLIGAIVGLIGGVVFFYGYWWAGFALLIGRGLIDHIELFADDDQADSRNFVLCPGGAYDRSPCGTGTSAKLACLAADGKLQPSQVWRQASIIGSQFEASYAMEGDQLIPTLRGRAFMSAEATLLIDSNDPFGWGIQL